MKMTKVCNECGEEKGRDAFFLVANRKGAEKKHLSAACRECNVIRVRRYREQRRERFGSNGHHLMQTFGITVEQYGEMFVRQGGVCAICGEGNVRGMSLAVDHDHETGAVRGLLCNPCNSAISLLGDDPDRLRAAIDYLGAAAAAAQDASNYQR